MKDLTEAIVAFLMLSIVAYSHLIGDYDELDTYNKAAHNFQWVSHIREDVDHVHKMGNTDRYYIYVSAYGDIGAMDKNGKEILPCEYATVEYIDGNYMAAATLYDWKLFDARGKEAASFERIRYPYAYAGDRYFIKYGDNHIEDISDGITIIDAIEDKELIAYEDCYNAVKLEDGNWYISETPDIAGIAMRLVLNQRNTYESTTVTMQDEAAEEIDHAEDTTCGFFTDEKFRPLFDGKSYRLICQGDGLYVARVMERAGTLAASGERAAKGDVVVLNEKGELFEIEDEAILKRLKHYEKNGDLMKDTATVFKGENGMIGFKSLKRTGEPLYLDKDGNPLENREGNAGETETGETPEMEAYRALCPPFTDVELLPGTDHVLVNGEFGCGIIRWEGDGR